MLVRQYLRDMESLYRFCPGLAPSRTASPPVVEELSSELRRQEFLAWDLPDAGRNGSVYDDIADPFGFMRLAPVKSARGAMLWAAHRVAKA